MSTLANDACNSALEGEDTMSTKKLIMQIHIQDDYFDGFDYGIVELTQADMDRIRAMSELVKTAKTAIHDGAYKIVAWDFGIAVMKTDYDSETLADGLLPLIEPDECRIDCPCLNVTDTDFFWSFFPKHVNVHCETATFCISLLNNFDTVDGREVQREE